MVIGLLLYIFIPMRDYIKRKCMRRVEIDPEDQLKDGFFELQANRVHTDTLLTLRWRLIWCMSPGV